LLSTSMMPTQKSLWKLRRSLEDRLERINTRLRAIPGEMKPPCVEDSEQWRELRGEWNELLALKRQTADQLAAMCERLTSEQERAHEKSISIFLRELDKRYLRSQEQWIKQGEWRTARAYRRQHLDARLQLEIEWGLPGVGGR
jgi:hypothetical protein